VVAADYVPARGDIVWLNFDPQAAHEQAGHRPALVLSPERYNRLRGMIICCPLTTRIKGYPFEVAVAGDPPSVILADQIKSLNWRARRAVRKDRATPQVLAEVDAKIRALLLL
jgi:mRNA interferase MazF